MLKDVPPQYVGREIEKRIQDFWEKVGAYTRTRELRKSGKRFNFVDGPPYTTGKIHLGTAWNKILKDVILRYKSMKGYSVQDRPGWDMHGLPIEVKVEEILGFKSKKDIEEYGLKEFIAKCKEFALKNKDAMTQQFRSLGVWMDWERPYMTLTNDYIDSAWWTFKQAYEKGFVEKGVRVVNWCPRCETALADAEVEYMEREDPSIYVKLKLTNESETYLVVWTTTPWTLPANVAVAVDPDAKYCVVRAVRRDGNTEKLIIMSELVEDVLRKGRYSSYEILKEVKGSELVGIEYELPLADEVPVHKSIKHRVYGADFVVAENTGCVHIAPGHGVEDFMLGETHSLPVLCPVGTDGVYTEEAGKYAGMFVKDADSVIIEDLERKEALLCRETVYHRYGHCWRCKSPIIYLATEQWFVKVSEIKDEMLDEIEKVEWTPAWAGEARFRDWIENSRDWCISRQRYWGIPIPIWECEKCGRRVVVGSEEELKRLTGLDEIELHRPYVDEILIGCECGAKMKRVEDIFDVWFDSAVASWATCGFPRHTPTLEGLWPADFITEGHDQTRGWFYSQLGASMIAFGCSPYKSVLMHGFTLDEFGRKMSKSLGNVVDPNEVVERYGADTLRLYVLHANAPWEDLRFSWEEVGNINRALNVLWNAYRFPLPYMVLDDFDPLKYSLTGASLREEDRWIISKLNTTIREVVEGIETYHLHRSVRALLNFVLEDLSRWYIQLVRPRTWRESDDPDKIAAYITLYEVLTKLSIMLAPFVPHIAEEMYQNLVRGVRDEAPVSVHMNGYVESDASLVDNELEKDMDTVRDVVEAVLNARQKAKRKLRWPILKVVVAPSNEEVVRACKRLEHVLIAQCNTKSLEVLKPGETWEGLLLRINPRFDRIGPVYKKETGQVVDAIRKMDTHAIKELVSKGSVNYQGFDISSEMVEFVYEVPENVFSSEFYGGVVYIDAKLTPEIEGEGYTKEIIRRVQEMRKEMGLDIDENIGVMISVQDERIVELVEGWKDFIAGEVRAENFVITVGGVDGDYKKEWDIEGKKLEIAISRT